MLDLCVHVHAHTQSTRSTQVHTGPQVLFQFTVFWSFNLYLIFFILFLVLEASSPSTSSSPSPSSSPSFSSSFFCSPSSLNGTSLGPTVRVTSWAGHSQQDVQMCASVCLHCGDREYLLFQGPPPATTPTPPPTLKLILGGITLSCLPCTEETYR